MFLDTGEIVRITDPMESWDFFNETHYSETGGTPVADDAARRPAAEIYGDPCNAPADCESLWYRYYAPGPGEGAYMNYYLQDGSLYYSWTRTGLAAHIDSFRTVPPLPDHGGGGSVGSVGTGG